MQAKAKSTAVSRDQHMANSARSAGNLRAARDRAAKKSNYDSTAVRAELAHLFRQTWGYDAREWQLDVTEAILLGLDCVLIAGTGSGKTMPFMLPLKYDTRGTILVISPLKILQQDQADRFTVAGIPAVPVNGDTWRSSLDFRKFLTSCEFQRRLRVVAIDEAHCVSQWGGDFRKHYAMLHKVRSLFPASVPFLAATATLPPKARDEVCTELHIDMDDAFFVNLGNDRPNITQEVRFVDSGHDYAALAEFLPTNATTPEEIPKTIIFVNSRTGAQEAAREIRKLFPPHLHDYIQFLHAIRKGRTKERVMERFREGAIKILIATEAAGMGADIPDIMLVIQLGIPGSLSIYLQRAGRAVRSATLQGRAILLVERSVFTLQNKRQSGKNSKREDQGKDDHEPDEATPPAEEAGAMGEDEGMLGDAAGEGTAVPARTQVWAKQCDPALREYIASKVCRRVAVDAYFDNPPRHQPPTGPCCDICEGKAPALPNEEPRATSKPSTSSKSTPTSPQKNNKRAQVPSSPARRGDLLKEIRAALRDWRVRTRKRDYPYSALPKEALMTDKVLGKLASDKTFKTVHDLKRLDPPWPYAERYGDAVFRVIRD
ncbi:P-loop containing nucleoside triphosphate hydrolase protein, partial [Schizophyllum commune]